MSIPSLEKKVVCIDLYGTLINSNKLVDECLDKEKYSRYTGERKSSVREYKGLEHFIKNKLGKGWISNLDPIEGAIESFRAINVQYKIYICLYKEKNYRDIPELIEWINKYIG